MRKKLTKIEEGYIGPNCTYLAGQPLSPTGRTWEEVHLISTANRIEILKRKGCPITLENLYNLGEDAVTEYPNLRTYDPLMEYLNQKDKKKKTTKKTKKK